MSISEFRYRRILVVLVLRKAEDISGGCVMLWRVGEEMSQAFVHLNPVWEVERKVWLVGRFGISGEDRPS